MEYDFKSVLITSKPMAPKKPEKPIADINQQILVNTRDLMRMLSLGRPSAITLGEKAEAKVSCGRKVMWNVERVREYINGMVDGQPSVFR